MYGTFLSDFCDCCVFICSKSSIAILVLDTCSMFHTYENICLNFSHVHEFYNYSTMDITDKV